MDQIPQGLSYAGLGAAMLGIVGWLMLKLAQRQMKRANAEGDLDARVVKMIEISVQPLKDVIALQSSMLNEERAEKLRAQAETQRTNEKFFKFADDATKAHDAKVDKLAERLHGRVDKCEEEHRQTKREADAFRAQVSELSRRLESFEARQYQNALATPSPAQPTVLMVPAPPVVATDTKAGPATS